ncbi:hypothetical protein EKL30_00230 [Candidimonas sp. SYP-B2681]|uniref:MAPEG family protein n=1 Tax=Candidimonas sp. SYP-B2681 TaxID=2497686 RepID=UPI000F8650FF|nr:MAPEG family protein [Candidimonas sp. SYP-B2681]RTZ47477.1 hypothetical protein EKL30_00230 [Candidimonas sp. SYP-B2681]
MNIIAWLMLIAAVLPVVAATISKAGGKGFDNNAPRSWLANQEGWRARANAAQANLFEALPFFYAAVLFALYKMVDPGLLVSLMSAWIALRVVYLVAYIAGYGTARSAVWALALAVNIGILFTTA